MRLKLKSDNANIQTYSLLVVRLSTWSEYEIGENNHKTYYYTYIVYIV